MRYLFGSVLFSLLYTFSQAQTNTAPLSVAYNNLGAYSLKETNVFSFSGNQAALTNLTTFTAGAYVERRFTLQELSLYQAGAALPTSSGIFGVSGSFFGNTAHRESSLGLAYGRKLGAKLAAGVQFDYFSLKISGYGAASAVALEGGVLYHINEALHLGLHARTPSTPLRNEDKEVIQDPVYTAGVGYEVSEQFFVSGAVQRSGDDKTSVAAGLSYRFDKKLWAKVGFQSLTSSSYIGLGFGLDACRLDAVASIHPQLGITPGLQFIFQPKQKAR